MDVEACEERVSVTWKKRRANGRTHHVRIHVFEPIPLHLAHHRRLPQRRDLAQPHRGVGGTPDKVDARDGAGQDVEDRKGDEDAVEDVLAVEGAVLVQGMWTGLELEVRMG